MSREIRLPESIRNLPRLVTTRQVVQAQFYAVAWTQRVILSSQHQPLGRLLLVYPDFGKPSVNEVVSRHIVYLDSSALMHLAV